ncbi:MAG TPA: hemerythrin domain-containing protein [Pseudonocardiaceae bacterium]
MKPTLDEATRPRRPLAGPGAEPPSPAGRAGQRTLTQVHEHLRGELQRVRRLTEDVCAQRISPADARDAINRTAMRQNHWTLGAFCASYCRVVTAHHTIEDVHLFTGLRTADATLAPVLDRLGEEHDVIAAMLDELDTALVALVRGECDADAVRDTVERFAAALLSHLDYEEEQLLEPIGRLSILV